MIRNRPQIHGNDYGMLENGNCKEMLDRRQTQGNEYGMLENGKVIVRKCPIEDKHKVMNTECKKMSGNDKEMPNLPRKSRPLSPGFPDLWAGP